MVEVPVPTQIKSKYCVVQSPADGIDAGLVLSSTALFSPTGCSYVVIKATSVFELDTVIVPLGTASLSISL